MKIAIIPARGGSKRIPRKNIKVFGGIPIIAWSIRAAIRSGCFDHVIVSTDDDEIANIAHAYGAEIPFIRPKELSDDHTGTIPVIAHAINWQNKNNIRQVKDACCIYATAPFLQDTHLQKGLEILNTTSTEYAFSVSSYAFPIQRAIRINQDNRIEMFQPEYLNTRSQDLEEAWHDAGQFYWGRAEAWLQAKPIFSNNSAPVPISRNCVQDIDTPEDWAIAELKFSILSHRNSQQQGDSECSLIAKNV